MENSSLAPGSGRICRDLGRRDGKAYVFGGVTGDATLPGDATRIYDPNSDKWTVGARLPLAVTEPASATGSNGRIYVMGGELQGAGRRSTSANNEYDPRSNSWRARAPMPTGRTAFALVAARDGSGRTLLYAIGGRDFKDARNGLSTVEAYDPEGNTWQTMAPMPTYRHALGATLGPDGKIYALGGAYRDTKPHFTAAMEVYDPRANSWSQAPSAPREMECEMIAASQGVRGRLFCYGGWYSPEKRDESGVFSYDPRRKTWQRLPDAPVASGAGGVILLKRSRGRQSLLLIGGTPTGKTCFEYYIPD